MKLSDRMEERDAVDRRSPHSTMEAGPASENALGDFKSNVHEALYARLGTELFDSSLSPERLAAQVSTEINDLMDATTAPLSAAERETLAEEIVSDVVGLGPL